MENFQMFNLDSEEAEEPEIKLPTSVAAAAKSLQSCLTLCDPIDGSPPGSPIPGILQARTLEWVAISFSNAWKWKVKVELLSRVWLLATPWTAAYQAPPSVGFSKQEVLEWGAIAFSTKCSEAGPKSRLQNQELRVGKREHQRKSHAWHAPGPEEVQSVFFEWISETMNEEEDSE